LGQGWQRQPGITKSIDGRGGQGDLRSPAKPFTGKFFVMRIIADSPVPHLNAAVPLKKY